MGNFSKWRKLEEAKGRDDAYYRNDTRSQAEIQGYDLGYDHPDNVSREDLLRYIGEARRRNNTYMGAESGSGLDWHYSHQFDEHSKDDDDSLDFTSPVKRSNTAKKATDGNNARPSNLFQAALGAFSTFSPVAGNKSGFTPENNTHYAQMDPALAEKALMGFYATHPQDFTTNLPYTTVGKDRLTELAQQLRVSQQENEGSISRQRQKALEEEAARRQAWFDERADKYANIPLKDDFEQNISGWEDVGKANDPLMTEAARGYELTVPLENRDADTQNALKQQEADSAYNVSRMSPTERKVYRYLQNTEGKEAAQDYMDYLSYRLNARNMNEVRAAAERGTETTGGKIVHSALSVPANLAGGALGAADYAIQNVRSKFSYRPIDYNSGGQIPGEYASAVRENTQEDMGNVGRFVYGTAMSMADSAASMLTIGKGGGALLGLSAGRQGVKDAIDAGATDSQAIAMGLFNGAAEMIFENIGIDNLYSILESGGTRTFKAAVKSILGQALSEGTEEVGTTLANTWGDAIIMADKSEINRMIDEYMSEGASREQATRAAWLNWAQNLGMDFLGGLTSGALFGIGGTIIANAKNDSEIGRAFKQNGAPNGMRIEDAISEVTNVPNLYSNSTDTLALYIRESGIENVSDRTLGRFYRLFTQDQQNLQQSGINDFEIAEYVERGMEPYRDSRTNSETSIARDEAGNVDVEQTLRNAAQMEVARETEQNDADTRRAWEDALSMPQQNTAIDTAAQRMVDEYTNRMQENAAASNQSMPVTAQEAEQERSVASPEESVAQAQKTPQAAENGVQAQPANNIKPFKTTKSMLNKFDKNISGNNGRLSKFTIDGHTFATDGYLVLLVDDVKESDERIILANTADHFAQEANNVSNNATTPVSANDFIDIENRGRQAIINVDGYYSLFDRKKLDALTNAAQLYFGKGAFRGMGDAVVARNADGSLVGFLLSKKVSQEKAAEAVRVTLEKNQALEKAMQPYDETARKAFIKGWKRFKEPLLEAYADAFKSAYDAGKAGLSYEKFIQKGGYAAMLDQDTRMAAFAAGQRAAMAEQNAAKAQQIEQNAAKPQQEVSHNSYIKDDGSKTVREYLESVDEDFLEWIHGGGKQQFYVIQKVAGKLTEDIKRVLGVDVTGWDIIIEDRILNHILKDHGKSGKADHSMQFSEDIARMPYVIENYDDIQEGKKSSSYKESGANGRVHPASTVQISKVIGDKTYVVYEAVPITKKKTVYIGSAFFTNKKGDFADPGNTPGIMASEEASALVSTPTVTEATTSVKSASQKLAETLHPLLQKGTAFNSAFLFEQADKAFGGTQAQGIYTPKDAYDAMELAVNEYLLDFARDFNGDTKTAVRAIDKLQNLVDKLPTQTKRTAEMESFQQFSTPPTLAYLAAWVADISNTDTVLEPSAGIGGLAVYPKAWGAQTVVNELSERRLSVLENMGFDLVFNENAEQINNVLPADVHPSVVLMNPPFSSTAGRTSTNKTSNAARHIEQALLRLNDGGRLVAILGRGMADNAASFQKWWGDIKGKYNVRANISIDGKNYRKYGTSFDVQLVVIDKTGPQSGETLTGTFTDLKEIPQALRGIRDDRSEGIVRESGTGVEHGASVRTPVDRGNGGTDVGRSGDAVGDVTVRDSGRTDVSTGGTQGRDVDVAGTSGNVSEGVRQTDRDGRGSGRRGNGGVPAKRSDGNIRSGDIRSESQSALSGLNEGESLRDLKPEKQTPSKVNKRGAVKDNGVYAQYVPAPLPVSGAKPHPAHLVESAAMSAVQMPKATYVPDLPASLITSGAISDAQLENVVYAGQANEQTLPDGERRGYFIGDGTGVGKGRQIAAIIMDNIRQGRNKAVWISKNTSLFADAQRDWADIGGDKSLFINGRKGDFPKNPKQWERADGILFLTYGGLSHSPRNKETTNLDTVVSWLGKDFDGVIAFDEAHEMGNAISLKGKRGTKQPSQKALAGIELQKRLPNARIVYVSATGATEVSNLAYATRLGLWGKGTAFANVREFVDKIGSSGLAAMELVSRDLKASGSYLARSISYDDVKYDTLEHKLTRSQRTIYDTMSEAWQVVLQNVNEALSLTGQQNNGKSRGAALSTFYSYLQSFYNQVLTSMAMPSVVEDIQKQLDDGKSVVLQIVNTNEAQQDRAKKKAQEEGLSLEDLDMTPRDMLLQYLEKSFPIQVYEEYEDDNGNIKSRPVFDSKGNPVKDHQAEAMRDALIDRVKQMSVPDGALDILLNAFGTENVAEVTGRSSRVVYKKDASGNSVRVEERRSSSARDADTTAFQNGDKRILVFSQAGGTGKSYHADLRAKNQQQRVHYLIQPGWEAAKATQGFGRTHRSNQASAPIFKLVTTDVKGHKRFISTIARRLDQLGALTKGQRNTGSGIFGEKDNLESPIAIRALQTFYDMLGTDQFAGLDGKEVLQNLGLLSSFTDEFGNYKTNRDVASDMSRFLNRILALKVDEQNKVFDAFMSVYDEAYDWAVANDALDTGMETVKADSIDIIDDTVVRKDENTGAETRYVQANVKNKPRTISYKQLKDLKNDFVGLYRINDTGEVRAVYRIADKTNPRTGEVQRQYSMQTAVFGKSNTIMESRFNDRLTEIPKSEWQAAWREAIASAPEYNEQTYHMLTGSLLPIWGLLPQDDRVRVKRLTADDGRTYLGRIIDPSKIDSVLNSLGTTKRTKQTYSASDVFRRVMNGDDARLLYNGWHLKRSRVSGEQRIEITGKNLFEAADYPGVFSERIAYIYRYFIPTDEKTGVQVIEQIMKNNPVADVSRGAADDVEYMIRPQTPSTQQAPTQRVGAQQVNTLSLSEIVERLHHDFGVNVTIGHVRGSGVLGTYSNTTNGIRSRLYNDLPTISHELGHHLDNRYGITDSVPSAVSAELIRCAGSQQRGNATQAMKEGLAEFIRLYLQNSETATIDYPNIESLIRTRVDANDMALLDALANEVNAYYVQSEKTAASSIVSAEAGNADSRTLGEKIMDKGHQAYQDFVDSLHGIKLFSDRYGGNAYTLAMNSAYSDAVAANAIRGDQLRDLHGNIVGDGLRKALRGVKLSNKAEYAAFNEYLVVRHGPERLQEHMRVFANDRQNSTTWMNQRQSELESQYPEFRVAADRLYKYQRNVLFAYGVQTGLISQEAYDEWGARWSFYVPFNRQMDEKSYNGRGVKKGFANQNSTIRRARGSGRNIVNPLENVFSNTAKLITASMRNTVMQEIVRMVESNPDDMTANWLERVPDPIRVQRDNVSPVKSQIAQEAQNAFVFNDDLDALSDILQNVDDILIEYRRAATSRDNRVVTVLNGGQQSFWKINDELLFDSLVNMEPQRIPAVLRLLTNTNHLITSNLTGNNVVWSIFSNAPRDLMTALTYSKDKNLIHMVANIGKSYVNSFRGIKHVDKQSPMYQEFLSMGGGADSIYSSNRNIGKDARRMITGKREGVWDWVKSPLDLIEWISNTIEAGPRYAEYVARRNAGASPAEAIYAAHDVTVNFRRGGAKSRIINQVVPFFNANVQGVDKLARQMAASDVAPADRKKVSGIRMGVWLGVCMALGALMVAINHGNEEKERDYATLSTYTKNNYFCIPLGDGKFLTIPKPREIAVPSSFSSAVLEYAWNSNENAFDDFGEYAIDMAAPPIADNLATAVWKLFTESPEAAGEEASNALGDLGLLGVTHYLSANKDFLGRPIVSSSLENVEAKDQYTARTSKIAYAIGQAFNMSPVKIDYFFQNTLGGWWKNQQALFPMDNSNVDYTLGVASTWVRDNLYSTDIVNTMYDNATAAKRAANSDPDNGGKAAWNQQCNQMTTFYSRFYGLTKGNSGEQTRISRRTVLDMISDFNDSYGNGNETPEQKAVYDIVRSTGNTAILPVAMQTTIKYDSLSGKQEIELSPDAYVEYQTEYNALYWERAVILATRYANYPETASEKIEAMKKEVREQATEAALRRARKKN